MPGEHDQDWKKGPCAVINVCGDGHQPHPPYPPKPKKDCCDPCEAVDKGYSFVGYDDIGYISPVATVVAAQLLVNPAGSGKLLKISKRAMTAIGSEDENVLFSYSFDPVLTAPGLPAQIVCLNQSAATKVSVAQLYKLPLVSSFGTQLDAFNVSSNAAQNDSMIVLGEGHSLLVSFRANAENTRAAAFTYWMECKVKDHDHDHDHGDGEQPTPAPV